MIKVKDILFGGETGTLCVKHGQQIVNSNPTSSQKRALSTEVISKATEEQQNL